MIVSIVLILLLLIALVWMLVQNANLKRKLRLVDTITKNTKSLWVILDLKTMRVKTASNALLEIVGIAAKNVSEHDPREVIHPDDLKLLGVTFRSAQKTNVFERVRIRLRDARYGWQWYENYGFFMKDGSRTLFFCSYFPINDRMRISEELFETKRRMAIMLNNSFNIIWTLDCSSRALTLLTNVTRERFGVDDRSAGLLPSNEDFFLKEDLLSFRKMLNHRIEALLKNGMMRDKPQGFTIRVKNRDGSIVNFVTRSTLEKNDVGQFVLYGVSRVALDKDEFRDEFH